MSKKLKKLTRKFRERAERNTFYRQDSRSWYRVSPIQIWARPGTLQLYLEDDKRRSTYLQEIDINDLRFLLLAPAIAHPTKLREWYITYLSQKNSKATAEAIADIIMEALTEQKITLGTDEEVEQHLAQKKLEAQSTLDAIEDLPATGTDN